MKIQCSIHKHCRGKPERRIIDGKLTYWQGDQKINLGWNWVNVELELEELQAAVSQWGLAVAPALREPNRCERNFLSHQIALIDIDSGMSISDLADLDFYQRYGAGYYTTPSHTELAPRFRIMYVLPDAVNTAQGMREIYEGLQAIHEFADISCKDSTRFFYGTISATYSEFTGKILDDNAIYEMLERRQEKQQNRAVLPGRQYLTLKHSEKRGDLERVKQDLRILKIWYPDLNYARRIRITWAVVSELGQQQALQVMRELWPDHDKTGKYEMIMQGQRYSGVSMGTVIDMIRRHDPMYHRNVRTMTTDELKQQVKRLEGVKE